MLNNPDKIVPSLYLTLEEIEIDGELVLWVYVPVSSQVEFCDKKIFDRNGDADQDITKEENVLTGEKGFNLAAILLLGKDKVIQFACPGYRTDAIYRNGNAGRKRKYQQI